MHDSTHCCTAAEPWSAEMAELEIEHDELIELAQMFINQRRELIDDLRLAIESNDGSRLSRAAHKLRGSVGIFHSEEALSMLARLESLGREGKASEGQPTYQRLAEAIERLTNGLIDLVSHSNQLVAH